VDENPGTDAGESLPARAAPPGPNWDLIAVDYLYEHITIQALCRKHRITRGELLYRATRHKWKTLRGSYTDRGILIGMMLGVLELQIGHLEEVQMTKTGEKEVAVLGKLATTLEKLIDIEDKSRRPAGTGEDMQEIRNKLARRIENLKRQ
jgi:hypothetical protein